MFTFFFLFLVHPPLGLQVKLCCSCELHALECFLFFFVFFHDQCTKPNIYLNHSHNAPSLVITKSDILSFVCDEVTSPDSMQCCREWCWFPSTVYESKTSRLLKVYNLPLSVMPISPTPSSKQNCFHVFI